LTGIELLKVGFTIYRVKNLSKKTVVFRKKTTVF